MKVAPQPIKKAVSYFSVCGTAKLWELDFSHWFEDRSLNLFYLHVKKWNDDTWHSVVPKRIYPGRMAKRFIRLACYDGVLYWLFDAVPQSKSKKRSSKNRKKNV